VVFLEAPSVGAVLSHGTNILLDNRKVCLTVCGKPQLQMHVSTVLPDFTNHDEFRAHLRALFSDCGTIRNICIKNDSGGTMHAALTFDKSKSIIQIMNSNREAETKRNACALAEFLLIHRS